MRLLVIVTLVAIGALVATLAAYLLTVIVLLRRIRHTVGLILFGLRSIAHRAEPADAILGEINEDLTKARDRLVSVVGTEGEGEAGEGAPQIKKPGSI